MKDYKFLGIASTIFKVLAWVILALGVVMGLLVLITGGGPTPAGVPPTPRAAGLVFILMGAFYFLLMYSISEVITLLLDMNASCKKTAV